ncbi:MAG: DNA-binding NarL/FixJ family response regulator [Saprospiraceae bacterium]|jgi:DNA-binding NarL/FixJ family response regulator
MCLCNQNQIVNMKIKIAIADDELLFRRGLRAILSKHEDIDVLFGASDGKDLIQQLQDSKELPEIIITDLKMPEMDGVEATKIIRETHPDIKIIALTSYFSKPFIVNMIAIGAVAYLAKNSTPKLMVQTIREVHAKGFYYNDKVFEFIKEGNTNSISKIKANSFDRTNFSKREMEVIQLICQQLTTVEIAQQLFISPRTVEVHRNNLLLKANVKNVAGLVIYAIQHNLVTFDKFY